MRNLLTLFVFFLLFLCNNAICTETITTNLDLPEAEVAETFSNFPVYDVHVAFAAPDGLSLISAISSGQGKTGKTEIFHWNIADRKIAKSVKFQASGIAEAGLSSNGRVLTVGLIAGNVLCWDMKGGKQLVLQPHQNLLSNIAVAADGKNIATCGILDSTIKETSLSVRENHSSRTIHTLPKGSQCISLAYSPDGQFLCGGVFPGIVMLWDAKTLEKKWESKAHSKRFQILFTPDSKQMLTVEWNDKIVLWDVQTGTELAVMKPNGFPINNACISPDGKLFATLGTVRETGKQIVVIWNLETQKGIFQYSLTGDQQLPAPQPNAPVPGNIAFMPDGLGLVVFAKKPFLLHFTP